MRSNGNSKIIGAAIAPTAPLASLTPRPDEPREAITITTKVTTTAVKVIGAMRSLGAAVDAVRSYS
jgi:hypothetical protein